jgi:hypothetical protein
MSKVKRNSGLKWDNFTDNIPLRDVNCSSLSWYP